MIDNLKSKLASQQIDVSTLTTLDRAVADSNTVLDDESQVEGHNQTELYVLPLALGETVSVWQRLRTIGKDLGCSPVILGDKTSLIHHWQSRNRVWSPTFYLMEADDCDAPAWLQEQWEGCFSDDSFTEADIRGDWDTQVRPLNSLDVALFDISPAPIQYIGFLDTLINTDLPAYLPFGDWNACPLPNEHVCVHRYWNSIYQTEIVALLGDTLICYVGNPVKERDSALALAREYMAYCEDSVMQGTDTLDRLASMLFNSSYWSFWWD